MLQPKFARPRCQCNRVSLHLSYVTGQVREEGYKGISKRGQSPGTHPLNPFGMFDTDKSGTLSAHPMRKSTRVFASVQPSVWQPALIFGLWYVDALVRYVQALSSLSLGALSACSSEPTCPPLRKDRQTLRKIICRFK